MFLIALLALALPAAATAQPGALDRGFGEGGRISTQVSPILGGDFLPPLRETGAVHLDAAIDGSTVVALRNSILRYDPSGRPDRRFGEGGRVTIPAINGFPFQLTDVAVDAGRVWAFGSVRDPSVERNVYLPIPANPNFAVVLRFDPTGQLDASFGEGDGIFLSDLGLRSTAAGGIPLIAIESAEIDSKGRPVFSIAEFATSPRFGRLPFGRVTDTLARLTSTGELDPSFGDGGVMTNILNHNQIYEDFCLSDEDRPIVATNRFAASPAIGWVTRLRSGGAIDRDFASGGSGLVPGGSGPLGCGPAGGIALLQAPGHVRGNSRRWGVMRLSPTGRVHRDFGRDGKATINLPRGAGLTTIAAGWNGRVLLAGTVRVSTPGRARTNSFFTVIRLLASGKPDRRFGKGGWIRTGFGRRATVSADEAVIDGSARLVLAGRGRLPRHQLESLRLVRYRLRR